VIDRSRGDEPWLVLTGDSLFVGDAGRPDLASRRSEGARAVPQPAPARRARRRRRGLPGHVAGSLCGAAMSSKASTTIGFERRFNPRSRASSTTSSPSARAQPPRPPNMERIVELNRGSSSERSRRSSDSIAPGDAIVLDVRPTEVFAAGTGPAQSGSRRRLELRDQGGVRAAERLSCSMRATRPSARSGTRAALPSGCSTSQAGRRAGAASKLEPVSLDELERLLADDAIELLDVRETDERTRATSRLASSPLPDRARRAEAGLLTGSRS
jgi:rhodanese-related sulfurtransferase